PFSTSAGLAASTVTPRSTGPDESLTAPAMDACAYADDGTMVITEETSTASLMYRPTTLPPIDMPSCLVRRIIPSEVQEQAFPDRAPARRPRETASTAPPASLPVAPPAHAGVRC